MRHLLYFRLNLPRGRELAFSEVSCVLGTLQRSYWIPIPHFWVYASCCSNDGTESKRSFRTWPRPVSWRMTARRFSPRTVEVKSPWQSISSQLVSGGVFVLLGIPGSASGVLFKFLNVCFAHNCAVWKQWLIPKQSRVEYSPVYLRLSCGTCVDFKDNL